jgi:hypothetical protein
MSTACAPPPPKTKGSPDGAWREVGGVRFNHKAVIWYQGQQCCEFGAASTLSLITHPPIGNGEWAAGLAPPASPIPSQLPTPPYAHHALLLPACGLTP